MTKSRLLGCTLSVLIATQLGFGIYFIYRSAVNPRKLLISSFVRARTYICL